MNLLIVGGTGQVGTELTAIALSNGAHVEAPRRDQLSLCSETQIAHWINHKRWDAVINAAAHTQVDAAELHAKDAWAANADGPGRLASHAARRGIPLIHISTDYVFDGNKGLPYHEMDPVAPLNVYGLSKEAGERAVRSANARHIILRTSWLFSPRGRNFVTTMLRLAEQREHLTIVSDQKGCPTAARDIGQACFELACQITSKPSRAAFGTYHFAGAGEATWFEFANAIFEFAKGHLKQVPEITPILTADYPTAARRPLDSRLNCRSIANEWNIVPRHWKASLEQTLGEILGAT